MDRNMWTGIGIGLAGGLVAGYFIGGHFAENVVVAPPAPVAAAAPGPSPFQAPGQPPQPGGVDAMALQRRIFSNEQVVATDPKNVQAWVALGNDHFDLHQPEKSIEAYGKAMELAGPNADLLTDQGVMYRELKQFDKALANFEKANKLNPRHLQSLINIGVVYAADKKDVPNALKAWNKVIATDPASPQAEQARQSIAALQSPHDHK